MSRNAIRAVALAIAIVTHGAAASVHGQVAPAADGRSLAETSAWIKRTLVSVGPVYVKLTDTVAEEVTYPRAEIVAKSLSIVAREVFMDRSAGPPQVHEYEHEATIPLADVDPQNVRVREQAPGEKVFFVDIATTGRAKTILVRSIEPAMANAPPAAEAMSLLPLAFDDKATAECVAEAIALAATLCGAKAEPR
jgi:hypothetical protein